jgi:DNA polymerase-3 subunit epsilon
MNADDQGKAGASRAALEAAAHTLAQSADFRVLRRLEPASNFAPLPAEALARAVVVDVETTGTSLADDSMIEAALLAFEFAPSTGSIIRVADSYDGLEDPGRPIPPEATAIHGITDDMVRGRRLDEGRMAEVVRGASLVIAHRASFDRPFLEARLPLLAELPWACSYEQIPWHTEGYAGAKLEYLAWQSGFFYDAHRSLVDCQALLELLRRPLPRSGQIAFEVLRRAAEQRSFRLWALESPFDAKQLLKERGYRWHAERRCWHRTLGREDARSEAVWLKGEVYGGRAVQVEVETLDARTRFSSRRGPVALRSL